MLDQLNKGWSSGIAVRDTMGRAQLCLMTIYKKQEEHP